MGRQIRLERPEPGRDLREGDGQALHTQEHTRTPRGTSGGTSARTPRTIAFRRPASPDARLPVVTSASRRSTGPIAGLVILALLAAACGASVPSLEAPILDPDAGRRHPGPDDRPLRPVGLSGQGRRPVWPEGRARRVPRALHGQPQAHPGGGRDDRRLRAVLRPTSPSSRRSPTRRSASTTPAGCASHIDPVAPRSPGHRHGGQRDRAVPARGMERGHGGQPRPQRRPLGRSRRQRAGHRPLGGRVAGARRTSSRPAPWTASTTWHPRASRPSTPTSARSSRRGPASMPSISASATWSRRSTTRTSGARWRSGSTGTGSSRTLPPSARLASFAAPCALPLRVRGRRPGTASTRPSRRRRSPRPGSRRAFPRRSATRGPPARPCPIRPPSRAPSRPSSRRTSASRPRSSPMADDAFRAEVAQGTLDGIHLLAHTPAYPDVSASLDPRFGGGGPGEVGRPYDDITKALARRSRDDQRTEARGGLQEGQRRHPRARGDHPGRARSARTRPSWPMSTGGLASPLHLEAFALMTPGDRRQLVWLTTHEPPGLYCADETDAGRRPALRPGRREPLPLRARWRGGHPGPRQEVLARRRPRGLDLHAQAGRPVRRRVALRCQRRRPELRRPVGRRAPAPPRARGPIRHLRPVVRRLPESAGRLTPAIAPAPDA